MSVRHALIAACTLVLACPPVEAAFRYRVKPLTLEMLLSYEQDSDEWTRAAARYKTETSTMREKFDIGTSGWLYHPAMLTFSLGLRPEFQQERIVRDRGENYERTGTFLGFNVDTVLLPYKPYTVELHASQHRNEYKNTLARDLTSESSIYRARLLLKEYRLPTTVTVESRDRTTESFISTRDRTDLAKVESRHRTGNSQTQVGAEFQDRLRGVSGNEVESERRLLTASNRYRPSTATTLNTHLRHIEDTWQDVGERTQMLLTSTLAIQHREKLRSDYQVRVDDRSDRAGDYRTQSARASLQHRLYENLTTTVNGDINKSEAPSGDLDSYGAGVNLAYTRRIPWGRVNAQAGHSERIRDWQRVLDDGQVFDEGHLLTWEEPWVELGRLDIDPDSIEVFSADRSIRYTRDIEYRIEAIGRVVQIHWLDELFPGDELRILVDYRYETDPSAKTHAVVNTFGAGVSLWSMLTLQYNWSQTQVGLRSGALGAEDTRDRSMQQLRATLKLGQRTLKSTTTASVEQRKIAGEEWEEGRGSASQDTQSLRQAVRIGNWSATTFEVIDKTISGDSRAYGWSPTRTQRARQTLTFRPARRLSLGLSANYSEIEYKDTGDRTESSGVAAQMRWRVGPGGALSASAYTRELKTRTDETESMGVEANYRWRYGLWYPSVRYTLAEEDRQPIDEALQGSKRTRQVLYFEARREFR